MGVVDYKKFSLVNENYAQAKKFLKDAFILNKALRMVNNEYGTDATGIFLKDKVVDNIPYKDVSEDDIKKANDLVYKMHRGEDEQLLKIGKKLDKDSQTTERSDYLRKIREMCGKKLGYSYMYIYLMMQEGVAFEEIQELHKNLMANNDLMNLLRRNITSYIDTNVPNNYEQIIDDLENIRLHKKLKKFVNEFPSHLKRDFKNAPPYVKNKLIEIANAFDEIGMEGGKIDPERQKSIQKRFFEKIRRYRNLQDMSVAAENFLTAEQNAGFSKFQDAIEECNRKFGQFGVNVVFDDESIIVMEVLTFQACRELFSNTSWCIKDSRSMWNSYVGTDKNNKQYMISNFNLPSSDNKSVIGITIGPGQSIKACHLKNDGSASNNIKRILNDFESEIDLMERGYLWSLLKPLTNEEIERRRRRATANRRIVEPNLSLEALKTLIVEDGADPNTGSSGQEGAALHNAVLEYEQNPEQSMAKVKYLFEMGANPNLRIGNNLGNSRGSSQLSTVANVQDFEMLKLFVKAGAILTSSIIKKLAHDTSAVKFCLDNGLNPNMEDDTPLRLAIKSGNLETVKLLIEYKADSSNVRGWMLQVALDYHHLDISDYFIDEMGLNGDFDKVMQWNVMTRYQHKDGTEWSVEEKFNFLAEIQSWIDSGRCVVDKGSSYRVNGPNAKRLLNYDEVISEFGSVIGWALRDQREYQPFVQKYHDSLKNK